MEDQALRLKIAELCNIKTLPNHNFYGRDDNRYFQCSQCGLTYSWSESKAMNHLTPDGPCPWTEDNYSNDLNAIINLIRSRIPEEEMKEYVRFLKKETGKYEHPITASPEQHCRAFIKFKERMTLTEA